MLYIQACTRKPVTWCREWSSLCVLWGSIHAITTQHIAKAFGVRLWRLATLAACHDWCFLYCRESECFGCNGMLNFWSRCFRPSARCIQSMLHATDSPRPICFLNKLPTSSFYGQLGTWLKALKSLLMLTVRRCPMCRIAGCFCDAEMCASSLCLAWLNAMHRCQISEYVCISNCSVVMRWIFMNDQVASHAGEVRYTRYPSAFNVGRFIN